MNLLLINSRIHNYQIRISNTFEYFKALGNDDHVVYFVDEIVYNNFKNLFLGIDNKKLFLIKSVECRKNLDSAVEIYKFLLNFETKKRTHIVSVGGGIVQDITGFVASTLYRGVKWTLFPSTLLSQVDSCMGSKYSLNFEEYKNVLGGFYPPHNIEICTPFLQTLSKREIDSGIGEIIKFLLLQENGLSIIEIAEVISEVRAGGYLRPILLTHKAKKPYIESDEFDLGVRNLFNFGHCFGHAFESSTNFDVPHGVAVLVGMMFANIVSLERGYISSAFYEEINERLFIPNISIKLRDEYFDFSRILQAFKKDKKRISSELPLVLIRSFNFDRPQFAKTDDLSFDELKKCILLLKREFNL